MGAINLSLESMNKVIILGTAVMTVILIMAGCAFDNLSIEHGHIGRPVDVPQGHSLGTLQSLIVS